MALHLAAHHGIWFQPFRYGQADELLGVAGGVEFLPVFIDDAVDGIADQMALGLEEFYSLAEFEVVPLFYPGQALFFIIGLDEADEIMCLGIARLAVDLVGRRRPGNGEAPRVGPMGNLFQFVEPFLADREVFRVGFVGVEGLAVDLGHGGDVVDALHAPFDLQARKAGVVEVRQVRQETEVLGVEDIRPPFIFDDGEILAWPLLFDDVVLEAAALDTFTAVRVAVALGEVIAQQTAAGIGNAHGAVDEAFQFDIGDFGIDFLDVAEAHFAGHDDARCAVVAPEFRRCPVGRVGLGRYVDRQVRHELPGQGEDARVGDEDGVDADIAQVDEVFRQALEVVVMREDVDRHVDVLAPGMGIVDGFLQFFIGKVVAESPQAEGLPSQVYGIGAV